MSEYRDHFDIELERAGRKITETGQKVAAYRSRVGPVTGNAATRDGSIDITVTPGGALLDLRISNAALTLQPEDLAAEIVRLVGRATRDANGRMHQSLRSMAGPEVARGLTELGIKPTVDGADGPDDNEGPGVGFDGVLRRPV